jgi:hypothetical protein
MSGGLRHHNDEENGPSHAVGYKSSKKQDCYSLERNQCVCADGKVCPDLQKQKSESLDTADVVRDVEKQARPVGASCLLRVRLPLSHGSRALIRFAFSAGTAVGNVAQVEECAGFVNRAPEGEAVAVGVAAGQDDF